MLYTVTGLCVILVNVLVNSTKFPIFCDTLYVASVAEKWLPQIKFTGATLALVAWNFSYTLEWIRNIIMKIALTKYLKIVMSYH